MQIEPIEAWLSPKSSPLLIAGPCSVESEEQMMNTADSLAKTGLVTAFRGGVWKPRTKPGSFEGIGQQALQWLKQAGVKHNVPVTTEVANAKHVEQALKAEIDILWIGARTTVNPFYVQEIADALQGTDVPVMVKNPIHPEVKLWLGAFERLAHSGLKKMVAIHRGFYAYQSQPFRNEPKWEVFFELRRLAPDLPVICDPSHIAGRSELIGEVCQSALDLGINGFLIESHIEPHKALSDPLQQLRPYDLELVYKALEKREEAIDDERFISKLEELRQQIDDIDNQILNLVSERQDLAKAIGPVKYENQATVFQMRRWFKVLESRKQRGLSLDLEEELVHELFQLLHKYSIDTQIKNHH